MTPEQQERMDEICEQIATEQDPMIFDELVRELNELLELKHDRAHPEYKTN